MATSVRVSGTVGLFYFLLAAGCSNNSAGGFINSSGGNGTTIYPGTGSVPSTSSPNAGGTTSVFTGNPTELGALQLSCGNGKQDPNELCDDGNKVAGDGCTKVCQIEAEFDCPTWGQPCISSVKCGDGKLASTETCDDGNTIDDDGCSADCKKVADGMQCRVPGKRCVPLCGDSKITGTENCDDGNDASSDGCSSTCLTEPGYSCTGTPSVCNASKCGNGVKEAGESCDKGAANGLFYGDGQGCSKTCTQEPNCRPDGTTTKACTTACGDANIDPGEDCDDGNAVAGDGCGVDCKKETGFTCTDTDVPDTTDCTTGGGKCLVLPVTYRDFDGQQVSGGHPDFFFYGAAATGGRTTGVVAGTTKTTCVPNAGGVKAAVPTDSSCPNSDASGPCLGLVADTLGPNGKPVYAKGTCPCVFTDWDKTGVLGTCPASGTGQCTLPGTASVTDCWVTGEGSHRLRVDTTVTVIQSAESFKQWYTDSTTSTMVRGTLELAALAGTQYQFSSAKGRTIPDDVHDIFMKTGVVTSLSSGFFPLEDQTRQKVCNLWPYWAASLGSTNCVAQSGNPVPSQWDPKGSYTAGTAGTGGPVSPVTGMMRNFFFTSEVRYLFRYAGTGSSLAFYGDDDVWVFINGKLGLDLGAPHERLQGSVSIDATKFGLETGKTYEIVVFHADRHPRDSNYQLTMSSFATKKTSCAPRCGDSVATAGEECDDGDAGNKPVADAYNACTTQCKYGPYCGDGEINGTEACDNGAKNGATYGTPNGCTNACTKVHYCGDNIIDSQYGEECDGGTSCKSDCTLIQITV